MELGHGPKELVFQKFYCTVCLCYIQRFGKPSKSIQTQNNPQKLQLQGANDSEKCFDWKMKLKTQEWGEKHEIACAENVQKKKWWTEEIWHHNPHTQKKRQREWKKPCAKTNWTNFGGVSTLSTGFCFCFPSYLSGGSGRSLMGLATFLLLWINHRKVQTSESKGKKRELETLWALRGFRSDKNPWLNRSQP